MSESEEIVVEEDVAEPAADSEESTKSEEFVVKGEELVETVKKLAREAGVRRIVIRNKDERTLIAGIALLPAWSALALIAALVTECSIVVEKKSQKEPETETTEAD